jgi:hypothetical protein
LYLSKDARMDPQVFKASYQNYPEFVSIIKKYDPQRNFESHQSQRLKI